MTQFPQPHGLYDPAHEHDSCGVGFVAHIKGVASHQIILDAEQILRHMTHRGACGCEENTGDGAGILTALPHRFLQKAAKAELHIDPPGPGRYGAGIFFLPTEKSARKEFKKIVAELVAEQGQTLLGWRNVPQLPDAADIGPSARLAEPRMEMLLVGAADGLDQEALERQLFVIRKIASQDRKSVV